MATLSVTNTFVGGTLAKSSEVNANFIDLINWSSGNIQNDNLGEMFGAISWTITTGVKAIEITNSGNDGSILITQSASLNPNKSSIRVINNAAQTAGDADVYLNMSSISSTVPVFQADYAGEAVFKIGKHRIELPNKTKTQRDSITPAQGSILYIEESPATRFTGVHIKKAAGWELLSIPAGVTLPYAGSNIPEGYLICDGSAVLRTTYATLFAAIGTTWGSGNGTTTFNVPDLRRRTIIGSGGTQVTGPANTLGSTGGDESFQSHAHTLSGSGSHSHTVSDPGHQHVLHFSGTAADFNNYGLFGTTPYGNTTPIFDNTANFGNLALTSSVGTGISIPSGGTHTHTVDSNGSGSAGNMPPSAVFNYIIKT
jgi:microcystin-dependent protein